MGQNNAVGPDSPGGGWLERRGAGLEEAHGGGDGLRAPPPGSVSMT